MIIFIEPIHAMISCFLSSMNMNRKITEIDVISFYFVSVSVGVYLGFYRNWGLFGIWMGWLVGLLVSIGLMAYVLLRINFNNQTESMLEENSEFQKTIVQTVRESMAENL